MLRKKKCKNSISGALMSVCGYLNLKRSGVDEGPVLRTDVRLALIFFASTSKNLKGHFERAYCFCFVRYFIRFFFFFFQSGLNHCVTHKSTVARTVMCRQDGRGRFPVLLDDHSKCRTNSQRKSQLS